MGLSLVPCKYCFSYMLNHPTLLNWKKCPNCAYCVEIKKEKKDEPKSKQNSDPR